MEYNSELYSLSNVDVVQIAYEQLQEKLPVKRLFTDRWRETEIGLYPDVPVSDIRGMMKSIDLNNELKVETTGYAHHICPKNMNKLEGLKKASKLIDIGINRMISFGDSENDVEILDSCGYGIAPANAMELAKEAANYVTKGKYGACIREGLEHIGMKL